MGSEHLYFFQALGDALRLFGPLRRFEQPTDLNMTRLAVEEQGRAFWGWLAPQTAHSAGFHLAQKLQ